MVCLVSGSAVNWRYSVCYAIATAVGVGYLDRVFAEAVEVRGCWWVRLPMVGDVEWIEPSGDVVSCTRRLLRN